MKPGTMVVPKATVGSVSAWNVTSDVTPSSVVGYLRKGTIGLVIAVHARDLFVLGPGWVGWLSNMNLVEVE